jgi:hypothetical protein
MVRRMPVALSEGTISRRIGKAMKSCRFVTTRRRRESAKAERRVKRPAFQSFSGGRLTAAAVRRLRVRAAMSPTAARTPKVGIRR